jgi:cob(I)alamin adenosyltransferase
MVRLTKIYTRTGDKGQTALGDGKRVPKHALRVEAYGAVDEANAAVGVARLHCTKGDEADAMLDRIQNDLFDLGADLCVPLTDGETEGQALRIALDQVERLEAEIDRMNAELSPLASFILPGGSPAAAHLHVARTTTRRAERVVTALAETETLSAHAIAYINRLSDHLFVLARWTNDRGVHDVLWTPGKNRQR